MTFIVNADDKIEVGYKGQHFRVLVTKNGRDIVQGFTNDPAGGSIMQMCKYHPEWRLMNPRVEQVPDTERARWMAKNGKKDA